MPIFKTKADNNALLITLAIGILGFLLGTRLDCGESQGPADPILFPPTIIWKHDTVPFIDDTLRNPYKPVNPEITTYPILVMDTILKLRVDHDTIFIFTDTGSVVHDLYGFNSKFLTYKPENPKLIRERLGKKLMTMDLLNPDGEVWSMTYPMDLENYKYTWEDGDFKAEKLKALPLFSKLKFTSELTSSFTFNPLRNTTRLELDGTIWYGRFGLRAFGAYQTKSQPTFDFQVGPRIKIK